MITQQFKREPQRPKKDNNKSNELTSVVADDDFVQVFDGPVAILRHKTRQQRILCRTRNLQTMWTNGTKWETILRHVIAAAQKLNFSYRMLWEIMNTNVGRRKWNANKWRAETYQQNSVFVEVFRPGVLQYISVNEAGIFTNRLRQLHLPVRYKNSSKKRTIVIKQLTDS